MKEQSTKAKSTMYFNAQIRVLIHDFVFYNLIECSNMHKSVLVHRNTNCNTQSNINMPLFYS